MYIRNQCGARTDLVVSFALTSVPRHDYYFLISSSFSFLHPLLGAFVKLRKTTIIFMSVRPSTWNNSAVTGRIFMKFDIWVFFENSSKKLNPTRMKGTLHGNKYTFSILSRSVLLRMKNSSDKGCRETRNTHFMFDNFFLENRVVYEIMWKKYRRAGQATDDNMAHAHCVLGP
jgi:hypothetical protein